MAGEGMAGSSLPCCATVVGVEVILWLQQTQNSAVGLVNDSIKDQYETIRPETKEHCSDSADCQLRTTYSDVNQSWILCGAF